MKSRIFGLLAACALLTPALSQAQEHWSEGPVWVCGAYQTNPGQFDNYMKWLRTHFAVTNAEDKKQGLILDYKVYVKSPRDENDYDVLICRLHSSYGKALDYNQADEDKSDAINAAHWKTTNQDEQTSMSAPRLEMRKFMGTSYHREVNLRAMP
jgi:hypothetical protein